MHPRWLRVCNLEQPRTALEAKFSLRLAAAMVLAGLPTGALGTYTDAVCTRGDLVALRDRVRVGTDEGLPDTAARVELQLFDGRRLQGAHDLDAELPLARRRQALRAKAAALVGEPCALRLWSAVDAVDSAPARELAMVLMG